MILRRKISRRERWPWHDCTPGEPVVRLAGVQKWFGDLHVLRGIDAEFYPGDVVAIIGPSGSGKSTLLRCINLLEVPELGSVVFKGRDITDVRVNLNDVRSCLGIVFQSFNLFPHRTALSNITLALEEVLGLGGEEASDRAHEELDRVGLRGKASAYPGRLSGGQQQRVAIARALAMRPDMLLFDEVTSALDPELVGEVLDVIRRLAHEKTTMVLVTHEMSFAREVASHVVFMDEGQIVERGTPEELFEYARTPRLQRFLAQVL
jgi:polar amino acid transport system ATP-binding protein